MSTLFLMLLSPVPESAGLLRLLMLLLNSLDVHVDVKAFGAFGCLSSSVFENNGNYPKYSRQEGKNGNPKSLTHRFPR